MAMKGFDWRGEAVRKRMEKATAVGINRTMGECVALSKANHTWQNRTGTAERSIRIYRSAVRVASQIRGWWGSVNVSYFKNLEFGSPPHLIFPTRGRVLVWKGKDGKRRGATVVRHPGTKAQPVLVPTAHKVYPRLAMHIRNAFGGVFG